MRAVFAEQLPKVLKFCQRHGLLPDPFAAGAHHRFGEPNPPYMERISGVSNASVPLSGYAVNAGDDDVARYEQRFAAVDRRAATPKAFGTIHAQNVKAWGQFGVLVAARESFVDAYCSIEALANPKYELPRLALPLLPVQSRFEKAIFLGPAWNHNHYHWLVDIVPRLQLVREELAGGWPVLVPPKLRPAQEEILAASLRAAGTQDAQVIRAPSGIIRIAHLLVPTAMNHSLDIVPEQHSFLRRAMGPVKTGSTRLYVSRADTNIRRIANEAEVCELLTQFGFEIVTLSGRSLTEQAQLFANADCVIGHHGAGLVNTMFCTSGATLIEIFQDGHFAPCFARIARLGSLRYAYLVGDPVGLDTVVDVQNIGRLLARLGIHERY